MLFFPVLASFFAFGALTAVASPAPSVEKRTSATEVLTTVVDIEAQVNVILPQIDALIGSPTATVADIAPLAAQLAGALRAGTAKIDAFEGKVDANSGGTKDEVAKKTADIYTNITATLSRVKAKNVLFYVTFLQYGIEGALIGTLLSLNTALDGIIALVRNLLDALDGLLSGLGLLNIKTLLGL